MKLPLDRNSFDCFNEAISIGYFECEGSWFCVTQRERHDSLAGVQNADVLLQELHADGKEVGFYERVILELRPGPGGVKQLITWFLWAVTANTRTF